MIRRFGTLGDGRQVEAIELGGPEGLMVEVLTYGAILRRLSFPVGADRRNLILGLDTLAQYEADRAYVGPVVGRFGNRIAGGRFAIDGQWHQLSRNENGNHLHGGHVGMGKRLWQVLDVEPGRAVTLGLHSPDGEEGYPGNLQVKLALAVSQSRLQIEFTAQTDAPTPVNLTFHPYFNLGGEATQHWLRIPASHYLPVGTGLIPTGELAPVAGTAFDFRGGRKACPPAPESHPQLLLGGGYDHCWVLDDDADCHAELRAPDGRLWLKVHGSGPGLQFYNGQFLSQAHAGIGTGLILEPQGFPDAPNQAAFPDAILLPGSEYRAGIIYELGA